MLRERGKLLRIGADDATLPLGDDIGRRTEQSGQLFLQLPPLFAQRRQIFPECRRIEGARKGLVSLRHSRQAFKGDPQRGGKLAQPGDIGLGNAAFPF